MRMSDLALWTRVLSRDEVKDIYMRSKYSPYNILKHIVIPAVIFGTFVRLYKIVPWVLDLWKKPWCVTIQMRSIKQNFNLHGTIYYFT